MGAVTGAVNFLLNPLGVVTGTAPHTGSWGISDYGYTEAANKLMGAPTNSQGGSQISNIYPTYASNQAGTSPTNAMDTYNGQNPATVTDYSAQKLTTNPTTPPGGGNPGTGQVLGQSDTKTGNQSIEDQQRNAYFSELDRQSGLLPQQQSDLESQINNLYGSQSSSINTSLGNSLSSLDLSKTNINSGEVNSLRKLDESMRNQLTSGNKLLGSYGAGDSTATNQLKYALGRTGSQNRTEIMKQGQQLLAQVDQQIYTAKSTASDQLQQLETWKNNQLVQISQYISSLKGNIDSARANYIQQNLANLDSQVQNYKQNIMTWVANKATTLQQYQQMIQQAGVGPTVAFPSNSVAGLNAPAQSSGSDLYGSYTNPNKKQDTISPAYPMYG